MGVEPNSKGTFTDDMPLNLSLSSTLPDIPSLYFGNMTKELTTFHSKLISNRALQFVFTINYSIVCAFICILGIVTNIINITVFVKMKFNKTINIALLALSVSDLASLIALLWNCICFNPLFMYSDVPINTFELQFKTGSWTHFIFMRVTAFITVYITLERCLCIVYPLKVKQILTHKRVIIIIIGIYTVVLLGMTPNYATAKLAWKFDPWRNRTVLGFVFNRHRLIIQTVSYYINVLFISISFIGVAVCSSILVHKLHQRGKWLGEVNSTQEVVTVSRDRQVIKMVICVAAIFIITHIPSVVNFMTAALVPEFGFGKKYGNLFLTMGSILLTCDALNSSLNIFIYYKMSSSYLKTFRALLCVKDTSQKE